MIAQMNPRAGSFILRTNERAPSTSLRVAGAARLDLIVNAGGQGCSLQIEDASSLSNEKSAPPTLPSGLVYVIDTLLPGIKRQPGGDGFIYRLPDGSVLRDEDELQRIRRLAIPPAYTEVWICPWPHGHLQSTGRDARGRKQYRYHAEWNALRNTDKFARLEAFGRALPRIRRCIARDLASNDSQKPSYGAVLATLIRLLDTTYIRVGNEAYARQNRSYGLTTLRNRHAGFVGSGLRLSFRGKHGIRHDISIEDPRVVRIVRRCKQLPGQELFQYEENGQVHGIDSGDVNDYLSDAAGDRFTAKDFRTWHGTVQAFEFIHQSCSKQGNNSGEAFSAQKMLSTVARQLGNTVAVCRKSYVHPAVLALAQAVKDSALSTPSWPRIEEKSGSPAGLQAGERRLLAFLADCAAQPVAEEIGRSGVRNKKQPKSP